MRPGGTQRAWGAWAALLADRSRLERRLQAAVASLRDRVRGEEERLRRGKLDALGEFAGGRRPRAEQSAGRDRRPRPVAAGPGGRTPRSRARSGIILGQAQRAHRILRDLMFVARPPAPRPRAVQAARAARLACCARVRAGMPGARRPAASPSWTTPRRMPGAIRTDSATSPRSCCATRSRPRRRGPDPRPLVARGRRADLVVQRQRQGDRPRRGRPPLRPVLLRPAGGPGAGPRPPPRREDRGAGRREAPLELHARARRPSSRSTCR